MRHILTVLAVFAVIMTSAAGSFEYKTTVNGVATETGNSATGYLWTGGSADSLRALVFAFQNMNEETLFRSDKFREAMASRNIGILWIAPGFGQEWDVMQGVQKPFDRLLADLAAKSGHADLARCR